MRCAEMNDDDEDEDDDDDDYGTLRGVEIVHDIL